MMNRVRMQSDITNFKLQIFLLSNISSLEAEEGFAMLS